MSTQRYSSGAQIFAGAGLGLLVGLIIGLSVSPVVQTILGVMGSLLGAFLGLQDGKVVESGDETAQTGAMLKAKMTALRMGSFGFVLALGIVLGMYIRTHEVFSMSITQEMARWTNAGYSTEEARKLVAFRRLGINPQTGAAEAPTEIQKSTQSVLYSATEHAENLCNELNPADFGNVPEEILNAYRAKKDSETLTDLANILSQVPADKQLEVLQTIWEGLCKLANTPKNQ